MRRSRSSDLPTMPPPFNVARFARDSEAKVTVVPPGPAAPRDLHDLGVEATAAAPQSEVRIATRRGMQAAETDEAWARNAVGLLVVAMSVDELKRLPLDHRAGYLLSRMDGSLDLDTLVEVAALPRRDVLRMVRALVDSSVVAFR